MSPHDISYRRLLPVARTSYTMPYIYMYLCVYVYVSVCVCVCTLYTLLGSIYSRRWRLLLLEGHSVQSFYRTRGSEVGGEIIKCDRDEYTASVKVAVVT